jgi:phosphomannomutase
MLKDAVIESKSDFGVGFDGDGDRIGVIDDEGFFIYGDMLLAILAREFLERNPGEKVMSEVKASKVLYDDIAARGGIPFMWMAGHSAQKAKMKEDNIKLAGETSGHIFYGENYNYDDALYAAVKLINFISTRGLKLSDIRKDFPKTYSTTEIRVETGDEKKFKVIEEITSRIKRSGRNFINVDGVRVETRDGWWLARASNTLPEITTRCEALSEDGLNVCKAELKQQLNESGLDISFEN